MAELYFSSQSGFSPLFTGRIAKGRVCRDRLVSLYNFVVTDEALDDPPRRSVVDKDWLNLTRPTLGHIFVVC